MSTAVHKHSASRGADRSMDSNTNKEKPIAPIELPMSGAPLKSSSTSSEGSLDVNGKADGMPKSRESSAPGSTKGEPRSPTASARAQKTENGSQKDNGSKRLSMSGPSPGGSPPISHSASTGGMQRSTSKPEVPGSSPSADLRYELTFMAPDDIVLNDDNWDQTLYEGGLRLLVAGSNTSSDQKVTTPPLHSLPHVDAVKREDYPLSKLFYLYLVISGKSKVDPEIVRWIVDFLTGPKKAYLIHLISHYSYRIRVKQASNTTKPKSIPKKKNHNRSDSSSSSSPPSSFAVAPAPPTLEIFKEPTGKDVELFDSVFASSVLGKGGNQAPFLPEIFDDGTRDRSLSLWEHRTRVSTFHWEIAPSALKVFDLLGKGAFGTVYKAKWMGTDVAVKVVDHESMSPEAYRDFLSEISMMSNLRHPNVLILLGGSLTPPNLYFVTEYMSQGSLDKVLLAYPHLDWKVRLSMAIDMAKGLYYLHHQSPPILHRDLKSLNILVDENFRCKVADFGLSVDKSENLKEKMGTLNWVAPECVGISGEPYDEKSDMWSFGMILWELVAGRIPFAGLTQLQVLRRIDTHELEPIPEGTDPRYAALIEWCWNSERRQRPSISNALSILEAIVTRN